jgi:hypothetical protein
MTDWIQVRAHTRKRPRRRTAAEKARAKLLKKQVMSVVTRKVNSVVGATAK